MNENIKNTVTETVNKVKENKTVSAVVDKINENEYVKKTKQSKHYKWIKLAVIIIAVLLVFNIFKGLFGDKNASKAEKFAKSEIITSFEAAGIDDYKITTDVIGKNKDSNLYAIDVVVKGTKPNGEKSTSMQIVIVYSDGDSVYGVNGYEYEKGNKKDIRDIALASLAKG